LAQTGLVVDALRVAHPGARFEVREITTQGDRDTKPLSEIGGQGVFTKAIEEALLRNEIDIAVHSMKDLPPRLTDGLVIAAVPERGDARDALVTKDGRTLVDLPAGARIGTGSARRAAQLKALRGGIRRLQGKPLDLASLDVECVEIRGNVDTRIRKVDDGQYDAIVLAMAGLERLGLESRASQVFSVEEMVPSPGQGALAVQVRKSDAEAIEACAVIDHRETHNAVTAERAFLEKLGAGCTLPVGAHATLGGDGSLELRTVVGQDDGTLKREETRVELPS
jgi:hydroxymethylbilane synthase